MFRNANVHLKNGAGWINSTEDCYICYAYTKMLKPFSLLIPKSGENATVNRWTVGYLRSRQSVKNATVNRWTVGDLRAPGGISTLHQAIKAHNCRRKVW
jgi:hypothetical protein